MTACSNACLIRWAEGCTQLFVHLCATQCNAVLTRLLSQWDKKLSAGNTLDGEIYFLGELFREKIYSNCFINIIMGHL